jgi:DNA topoisomerase-1
VAQSLGNTAAVARRSYIDPRIIDRFAEGRTIPPAGDRTAVEEAVLDLLAEG